MIAALGVTGLDTEAPFGCSSVATADLVAHGPLPQRHEIRPDELPALVEREPVGGLLEDDAVGVADQRERNSAYGAYEERQRHRRRQLGGRDTINFWLHRRVSRANTIGVRRPRPLDYVVGN